MSTKPCHARQGWFDSLKFPGEGFFPILSPIDWLTFSVSGRLQTKSKQQSKLIICIVEVAFVYQACLLVKYVVVLQVLRSVLFCSWSFQLGLRHKKVLATKTSNFFFFSSSSNFLSKTSSSTISGHIVNGHYCLGSF